MKLEKECFDYLMLQKRYFEIILYSFHVQLVILFLDIEYSVEY